MSFNSFSYFNLTHTSIFNFKFPNLSFQRVHCPTSDTWSNDNESFRVFGVAHRLAWAGTLGRGEAPEMRQQDDRFGRTTLHLACFRGHSEWVAGGLASVGGAANAALVDDAGWTALHWACVLLLKHIFNISFFLCCISTTRNKGNIYT